MRSATCAFASREHNVWEMLFQHKRSTWRTWDLSSVSAKDREEKLQTNAPRRGIKRRLHYICKFLGAFILLEQTPVGGSRGLSVKGQEPRRPSALIESPGRGSPKLPEDARPHPRPLLSSSFSFSPYLFPPFAVLFFGCDSTLRFCIRNAKGLCQRTRDARTRRTWRALTPVHKHIHMYVSYLHMYVCEQRIFAERVSRPPRRLAFFPLLPLSPALPPPFILAEDNLSFLSLILYSLSFISRRWLGRQTRMA